MRLSQSDLGKVSSILYDCNVIIFLKSPLSFTYQNRRYVTVEPAEKPSVAELHQQLTNAAKSIVILTVIQKELLAVAIPNHSEECVNASFRNLSISQRRTLKFYFMIRLQKKVQELIESSSVNLTEYSPTEGALKAVVDFYIKLDQAGDPRMEMLKVKKGRVKPDPSPVDCMLLCYSKENAAPIVTFDSDLVWFDKDLEAAGLTAGIIFPADGN